ncbi:bifunctional metallophosphatase/5'-nucleotidase [Halobacillus litoralis]|uniref:bifunctional metallophosphatase/5'-nucleotidase n=1 Tax=Halobacillus litoralis TaxID=45668 RepID=UPI001CFD8FBE|nr:bifunctional metallophosphatase/5'-nucleotidase [Halobacillus litoralis]WLR47263.1 bifunctional metallophosphatase/5'-nucleotidase [Halobacillus litoralis]
MFNKKQVLSFMLLIAFVFMLGSEKLYSKEDIEVQLLGVNDLHGQLDYEGTYKGKKVGGAEYLAAYLQSYEQQNPNTFLVHAGDMVGASPPVSSIFQDEPTVEFMNHLDFDIGTLGNHEFDEGVQEMKRLLNGGHHEATGYFSGATTPYTTANVIDENTGKSLLPPFIIKKVHGVNIGFIGVVTTDTNDFVLPENLQGVKIIDEVDAINNSVAQLKDKGVESIVVLGHVSAKSNKEGTQANREFVDMASEIDDEVDVMFAGHNHTYANKVVDGKLIVQSYSYGKAFSKVDLTIDPATKDIIQKEAEIVHTYHEEREPDPQTQYLLKKYEGMLHEGYNEVLTETEEGISRKKDKNGESPLAQIIARSLKEKMNADVAFVHHGGIRKSIKEGPIRAIDLHTVLPFKHYGVSLSMTGEEIKEVLAEQWTDKRTNLLQAAGLEYDWRETKEGIHLSNLKNDQGKLLKPEKEYTVAVSHYLAYGGDGFSGFGKGEIINEGPLLVDIFKDFMKKNGLENTK